MIAAQSIADRIVNCSYNSEEPACSMSMSDIHISLTHVSQGEEDGPAAETGASWSKSTARVSDEQVMRIKHRDTGCRDTGHRGLQWPS